MEQNGAVEPALSSTCTQGRGRTVAAAPLPLLARPMRALLAAAAVAFALAALASAPDALALAHAPGGAVAPSAPQAGGAQYGMAGRPPPTRPTVARLSVPRTARPGRPPRIVLRIEEPGVGTVYVRAAIVSLQTHGVVTTRTMGWVHTGRNVVMHWSGRARLGPGAYHVSLM